MKNGLKLGKVDVCSFFLKNGLPYTGVVATGDINPYDLIVQVPKHLILFLHDCYFSELRSMFDENPQIFSRQLCPDYYFSNIFWAFILFELPKGEKSKWYHMFANLPKDYDCILFWEDAEFDLLQDSHLKKKLVANKQAYQQLIKDFTKVIEKYPLLYPPTSYNADVIRWLAITVQTRSFGCQWVNDGMVSFCELFNHAPTRIIKTHQFDNATTYSESSVQRLEVNGAQVFETDSEDEGETKSSANNAETEPGATQHTAAVDKLLAAQIDSQTTFGAIADLIGQFTQQLRQEKGEELKFFAFALLKIEEELARIRAAEQQQQGADHEKNRQDLEGLFASIRGQWHALKAFRAKRGQPSKKPRDPKLEKYLDWINKQYDYLDSCKLFPKTLEEWPKDKFDCFSFFCHPKQAYKANSQVYYVYGKYSNKDMIHQYGFALENNKYEFEVLRHNFAKEVCVSSGAPKTGCGEKALKALNQKFVLNRRRFCLELYLSIKAKHLYLAGELLGEAALKKLYSLADTELEVRCLKEFILIIEQYQQAKFTYSIEQCESLLLDPHTMYHKYFSIVYIKERLLILRTQMDMAAMIMDCLKQGCHAQTKPLSVAEKPKGEIQTLQDNQNLWKSVLDRSFFQVMANN